MKRDIRSVIGQEHNYKEPAQDANPELMNNVQDAMNHYSGKSSDELMRELKGFREAGVIDDASLENVAEKIAPMLTPEQQQRMEHIMRQLRGE